MPNGETGKFRALAEAPAHKAASILTGNPIVMLTTAITFLGSCSAGIAWALNQIDQAQKKADSAVVAVAKVEGAVANIDKNLQWIVQMAQSKTSSSSSSSSESSHSSETVTTSHTVITYLEYAGDSVFRRHDTTFVPKPKDTDTSATKRPR